MRSLMQLIFHAVFIIIPSRHFLHDREVLVLPLDLVVCVPLPLVMKYGRKQCDGNLVGAFAPSGIVFTFRNRMTGGVSGM